MAKTRIPVRGTVGKALRTTSPSASNGSQAATDAAIATLQANVTALKNGNTGGGSPSGLTATVWSLIGEIPANISQLAGLTSSGAAFRKSDGTWVIRTFAVGASGLVAVTNGAGAAGNVTYDLASISARSIIANGTNAAAVPTAIQSAGDKSVVRQSGTTVAFNLIDNTFISDFAEAAQDAVGGILTNTATIHFTYNDAGNQITADVQVSATLDVVGSTRGNVLYRGASGWAVLPPGTSGFVLTTAGAGADPSWAAGGGGGGTALPGTIPDLQYWFKSDPILGANGGSIPVLQNYCPWQMTLSAANTGGGAHISSTQLNSLNVATFPASSGGRYNLSSSLALSVCTIFAVYKPASLPTAAFTCGASSSLEFRVETTGKLGLIQTQVAGIATSSAALSTGTWYQVNATYNSSSGAWAFRIGQAADSSGTNVKSITAANSAIAYNPATANEDLAGDLAELIIYTRVLTLTEIQSVEAYLHSKWGV